MPRSKKRPRWADLIDAHLPPCLTFSKAKEAEEEKRKESERKEQEEKRKSFIRNLLSKPTSDSYVILMKSAPHVSDSRSILLNSAGREPDRPLWCIEMPADITPSEIDIIKLTAQFVARNGPQFLSGLINREMRNPSFEFLVRVRSFSTSVLSKLSHADINIVPSDSSVECVFQRPDSTL